MTEAQESYVSRYGPLAPLEMTCVGSDKGYLWGEFYDFWSYPAPRWRLSAVAGT